MLRRWLWVAVVGVVAGLLALPGTATGQEPDGPQGNIIGGTVVPAGQQPWMAALVRRGQSRTFGFTCGGTVLSRSWVLTAAHCVLDYGDRYPDRVYGPYVAPSYFDVVTGTADLQDAGGQRLRVAAIHVHPGYDPVTNEWDVALLRLARPTVAPEVAVVGTSTAERALDDAGASATVVGWGTTSPSGNAVSADLRSVGVPVQSDATCQAAYPLGQRDDLGELIEFHAGSMVCAGPLAGGRDSCRGDSGGPLLVVAPDSTWRQIGVVSFGRGCAEAGYPGIYHRLTATSAWVATTRRFGPFDPDGFAYVAQQYLDFTGRVVPRNDLLVWLGVLGGGGDPAATVAFLQASHTWDESAGLVTRLYRATFQRDPDSGGLDYWVGRRWAGRGGVSIAQHFATSPEFTSTYGGLDDAAFVARLYRNVFDRDVDAGGLDYWTARLAAGTSRGQLLYELSKSSEFRAATAERVRVVTTWFGLLRRAPSAAEVALTEGLAPTDLIDMLRTSTSYASRFGA